MGDKRPSLKLVGIDKQEAKSHCLEFGVTPWPSSKVPDSGVEPWETSASSYDLV